jgi:hypothetical protein
MGLAVRVGHPPGHSVSLNRSAASFGQSGCFGVAQRFQRCDKFRVETWALAPEVHSIHQHRPDYPNLPSLSG